MRKICSQAISAFIPTGKYSTADFNAYKSIQVLAVRFELIELLGTFVLHVLILFPFIGRHDIGDFKKGVGKHCPTTKQWYKHLLHILFMRVTLANL